MSATLEAPATRFSATGLPTVRGIEGYSRREVERVLLRANRTLASPAGRVPARGERALISAEALRHARFSITRLRTGYAFEPVDELLDAAVEQLRSHESG